jgi:hypothetical protein
MPTSRCSRLAASRAGRVDGVVVAQRPVARDEADAHQPLLAAGGVEGEQMHAVAEAGRVRVDDEVLQGVVGREGEDDGDPARPRLVEDDHGAGAAGGDAFLGALEPEAGERHPLGRADPFRRDVGEITAVVLVLRVGAGDEDQGEVEGQRRRRRHAEQVQADAGAVGGRVGAGVVEALQVERLDGAGRQADRGGARLQFFEGRTAAAARQAHKCGHGWSSSGGSHRG